LGGTLSSEVLAIAANIKNFGLRADDFALFNCPANPYCMRQYIHSHWRGEQGLLKSCLLNGFIFPSVAVIAVLVLGLVVEAAYLWIASGFGAYVFDANPAKIGAYGGMACVLAVMPIFLWAAVGVLRCGVRNVRNSANTTNRRIGGAIALLFGVWLTASMLRSTATAFSNAITQFTGDVPTETYQEYARQLLAGDAIVRHARSIIDQLKPQLDPSAVAKLNWSVVEASYAACFRREITSWLDTDDPRMHQKITIRESDTWVRQFQVACIKEVTGVSNFPPSVPLP